jgi:hypothetical protein
MQTLATFVILSRLAVSLCITGSLASVSTTDVTAQSVNKRISYTESASASRSQATKLNTSTVLARNAAPKVEATATSATTKAAPPVGKKAKHDPKAVGRCWNRLMDMIREARQVRGREE